MVHEMKLKAVYFDKIKNGQKRIAREGGKTI